MRIIPHNEPQNSRTGHTGARQPRLSKAELQHRMARQAAIERSKARYLHLECGHYSTLEADERVSHWRPKKGQTWCDNCNDWVAIAKPPASPDYGDTPMF